MSEVSGQQSHDVFISYSSKNKKWADAVCSVLERRRIRCWVAPRDITPGLEWGAAIIDGIDGCKIVVLIFSAHANASAQVRREVERAISKGLTVIPFRIEDVAPAGAMEYALGNTHWLDGFTKPVERHLEVLARSVETLLPKNHGATTETIPIEEPIPTPHPRRFHPGILAGLVMAAMALLIGLLAFLRNRGGADEPTVVAATGSDRDDSEPAPSSTSRDTTKKKGSRGQGTAVTEKTKRTLSRDATPKKKSQRGPVAALLVDSNRRLFGKYTWKDHDYRCILTVVDVEEENGGWTGKFSATIEFDMNTPGYCKLEVSGGWRGDGVRMHTDRVVAGRPIFPVVYNATVSGDRLQGGYHNTANPELRGTIDVGLRR